MEQELSAIKKWLILINVGLSVFMATLDGSIVNIALPVIAKELSVNIGSIQWVVTSYLLAISVLLLVWGKVADLYGNKHIFAFGFIIFTFGSLLCGLSSNLTTLVISRIIQAVGASATMALSQGIVTATFPPHERGKSLGMIGTTVAIGSLSGPFLGGVLVHYFSWKSIFLINVPIGVVGAIFTFIMIPKTVPVTKTKGFDLKGTGMFIFSILVLFMSLLFLQEGSLNLITFLPLFLISLLTLFIFIMYERKVQNPLVDLSLFKIKIFSFGVSAGFLSFVAINSILLFLPFYLQYALGLSTLNAGLIVLFYPLTSAIVAPVSGWLSDRLSYRPLTILGLLITTLVLFVLSNVTTSSSHLLLSFLMCLLGAGGAMFQSPNNSSVMGSVPREQLGVAGGINALFRNLGMVSGSTLSVLLFAVTSKMNFNSISAKITNLSVESFMSGFQVVLLFAGFVNLIALLISLMGSVKPQPQKN